MNKPYLIAVRVVITLYNKMIYQLRSPSIFTSLYLIFDYSIDFTLNPTPY